MCPVATYDCITNYCELSSLKNTYLISYSFVGQKPDMVALGYNQGISRAMFLSGVHKGESVFCSFRFWQNETPEGLNSSCPHWPSQHLMSTCFPWILAPFLGLQSQQ